MKDQPQNPTRKTGDQPGPKGEGSYEGTRQYNDGLKEHVRHHDIEKEARDAAPKSVKEEQEMKDAEAAGKARSRGEDGSQDRKRDESPSRKP